MQQPKHKIHYLDGIRGIAAFIVLVHHFLLAFFVSFFFRDAATQHTNGREIQYGESVFSFLSNGNFAVCIFFVLSGYVLSRSYWVTPRYEILVSAASRRFFRLYIPVAFTLILSYLILQAGLMYNKPAARLTLSSWWLGAMWDIGNVHLAFLRSLAYSVMFRGDASCNTAVWTMQIELFGSLLVYALLALTHNIRNKWLPMVVVSLFFFITHAYYYFAFIAGIGMNYIEDLKDKWHNSVLLIVSSMLFICGLVLGSFPTDNNISHTVFEHTPTAIIKHQLWFHTIGAVMVITAAVMSKHIQHFFSMRSFWFLGDISFSLYLLHPVIISSFSCYLFLQLVPHASYIVATAITFISTVALTLVASYYMTRYIDKPGIGLSVMIHEKFFRK